jgi:Amt family ammonium transporter
MAGTVGLILTGLFATTAINSSAASGLFYGNPKQLGLEVLAAVVVWLYGSIATFVCLKIVNIFIPLRVTEEEEAMGLDITQHAEVAYAFTK